MNNILINILNGENQRSIFVDVCSAALFIQHLNRVSSLLFQHNLLPFGHLV